MSISRKFLREHCPNIPVLHKLLTRVRLYGYINDLMPENLVRECIADPIKKKDAIKKYSAKWPQKVAILRNEAAEYGIPSDIMGEVLFAAFAYGMRAEEFMYYNFALRSEEERSTFLSDIKYSELTVRMNNMFDADKYYNKANCFRTLGKYYRRDALVLTSKTPIIEVEAFFKKHPIFVKKVGKSSLGKGVSKIDLSEPRYGGVSTEEIVRGWLSDGEDLLLEELVIQSDALGVFNPSSVNTIRVITYTTKHGIIAPFTFLKTGKAGSFVDNGGQGGILIGINSATGELVTDGIDEKRNIYEFHPDSRIRYKGYKLPDWDQAIALCKEMASVMPTVKMVGWDLAHTDNGWVLIEANERSQIVGPQLVFNYGVKQDVLQIMSDMDLYCPF